MAEASNVAALPAAERPLKVLHVIATLAARYGGPSKACIEMAQAVARCGHEVAIYTTNLDGFGVVDMPLGRPVLQDSVAITYFPIQRPRFWCPSWPMAAALSTAIPKADIVHIHSLYLFHDWVAGHYCRRFGIPYLVRPHGTLAPHLYRRHRWRKMVMEQLFQNRVLRYATAMHYTTEEEQTLATPYVHGAPGVVVPLGLSVADYEELPRGDDLRRRYPECAGRKVILFFGRLNFVKGLDVLTEALGRVLRQRNDVHLLLVGPDGGMRTQTEAWLRANGALERTTFTGMLLGADKLEVLAASDVFVLPSYSESFGIAVVEAMACGLPVVISDRVGLCREVQAANAGHVIPPTAEACASALLEVLADPERARRLGANGRALVHRAFNWAVIGQNLADVYRTIVAPAEPTTAKQYAEAGTYTA